MKGSLFHIRKRWGAPVAWFMVLAMLSPMSAHGAERIVLCISDGDHMGVEASAASHHDERAVSKAAAFKAKAEASFRKSAPPASPARLAAASESGDDSSSCTDVPLRLVRAGDACYQAVPSVSGADVPAPAEQPTPLLVAQRAPVPAPPRESVAQHEQRAPASPFSLLYSSTVVLLM
jgi:hypothetical protein